jgi:hypothetical protein
MRESKEVIKHSRVNREELKVMAGKLGEAGRVPKAAAMISAAVLETC